MLPCPVTMSGFQSRVSSGRSVRAVDFSPSAPMRQRSMQAGGESKSSRATAAPENRSRLAVAAAVQAVAVVVAGAGWDGGRPGKRCEVGPVGVAVARAVAAAARRPSGGRVGGGAEKLPDVGGEVAFEEVARHVGEQSQLRTSIDTGVTEAAVSLLAKTGEASAAARRRRLPSDDRNAGRATRQI
jgi:hypothetical protein